METFCFKIINEPKKVYKIIRNSTFRVKIILYPSLFVSIKNKFIFFKFDHKEFDTNFKKLYFFNTYIFKYQESVNFYERNNFLIQKNLFPNILNLIFLKDGKLIKMIF